MTAAVQAAITAEFTGLADVLESLGEPAWDTPSLCAGWRVREVVAHMTLAVPVRARRLHRQLKACNGDFTTLSNRIAERDGPLPAATHLVNLRDSRMHAWTPPGGGQMGALSHVVIHSLDITVPLGAERPAPDETLIAILDHFTTGGAHAASAPAPRPPTRGHRRRLGPRHRPDDPRERRRPAPPHERTHRRSI